MTLAVGIDVGGTKIAAALVVESGRISEARGIPTDAQRGSAAVLEDCVVLASSLAAGRSVAAVGVAVCELVGVDGGVRSAQTVDWREVDVVGAFGEIAARVCVESDVRAAALAEARFGAGAGERDFVDVSVGTGVSHCLMVDGMPRLGVRGAAIRRGRARAPGAPGRAGRRRGSHRSRARGRSLGVGAEPGLPAGRRSVGRR